MALHVASGLGVSAIVRKLIQRGHNVNGYDGSGWTPLQNAAFYGHSKVARELIRAKADVNLKVKGPGRNVLCIAAYYIFQIMMKICVLCSRLILNAGVGIDEHDCFFESKTALMLAAQKGHSAVVAELVKAGADVRIKDKKEMTAVLLARNYDVIRQLMWENGNVERLSKKDRSHILWRACDKGDQSMVQCVIEAGCDVDHVHKGQTPVMMATLRGHDRIVKELILAKCDVNLKADVVFRDLALSLNFARLIQSKNTFSMAVLASILLPSIQFQMEVVVALLTDPMWALLTDPMWLILVGMVVILGAWLMPKSYTIMMLHVEVIAMAITVAMKLATVLGPMAWTVPLIAIVAIPVARKGQKATVTAVIREVAGTLVYVTLGMVSGLVTLFSLPEIFKWSPWDMTIMQVVTVALIIVNGIRIWKKLLKRTVLLKAFLKLMFLNVELFVMASSCMMMGRKTFFLHEIQTVQSVMELLVAAMVFRYFLQIMLTTQATEAVMYRGVVGVVAFEMMKLLDMENVLVSPDEVQHVLVLAVLLLVRVIVEAIGLVKVQVTVAKKAVLLKGLLLHLVVAVVDAYLALVISKEGAELQLRSINFENIVTALMTLTVAASIKADVTALHYAASYCRIECGNLLVKAGADVLAKNVYLRNPLQIGPESFVNKIQMVLSFTARKVIIIIGNSECGKSTLVSALEHTSNSLWKRVLNHFKKVHVRQRRGGIEAVALSNQKYGEALIYDFAGPSQYHSPHNSFLEAILSRPGVAVTLLLVVKATQEEDTINQQLHRWLQPLAQKSSCTPLVVVVGSFLDQVKSERVARNKLLRCTQLVQKELLLSIDGTFLLDCRQSESRAINQICNFLQVVPLICTESLSYNLHWVLVKVRKAFKTKLALRLHEFQAWVQNKKEAGKLPKNLPSSDEVCQDLSAAGHTLFLPNKDNSWLILDLPALLHKVYGTLFSGSQGNVNEFGLLHCSQLTELFPQLDPALIQEVLTNLEFCIEIEPVLLHKELAKLTNDRGKEGWLYFPALVSAQPCKVFPEDPDPDQFQWMCWQLRTAEKHFVSPHLLQTIILRLAANHVFTHKLCPSVKRHCCSVWANGLSWRSTKGVDVAVQISDSSVVQFIGRSQEGSERLHQYTSNIVRDIIKTTVQLSPHLESTPYIVHPYTPTLWNSPQAAQPDSLYPMSSIRSCIGNSDEYVLSLPGENGSYPQRIKPLELFGWSPSLSLVQDMDFREASNSAGECMQ